MYVRTFEDQENGSKNIVNRVPSRNFFINNTFTQSGTGTHVQTKGWYSLEEFRPGHRKVGSDVPSH